eukprot:5334046-Amphidinium_carterae.1
MNKDDASARQWEDHVRQGHFPKRKDCPTCQLGEGTVVRHYTQEEKSPNVLHMDFGDFGIHTAGYKGHRYFLAMIFRTLDSEGNTVVLPWFQPTNDRSSLSVQTQVRRLLALLPTLKPLQEAGIDTTVKGSIVTVRRNLLLSSPLLIRC